MADSKDDNSEKEKEVANNRMMQLNLDEEERDADGKEVEESDGDENDFFDGIVLAICYDNIRSDDGILLPFNQAMKTQSRELKFFAKTYPNFQKKGGSNINFSPMTVFLERELLL